jgi:putative acetyltransferase
MYKIKRTDSDDSDFQKLVTELDKDLAIRDGEDHAFFAQFNKIAAIKHVVVAYEELVLLWAVVQ